eukprot:TRINITY_DN3829_c0_g1_i1.p1 TRINITY_DN3829_c0_g1~~TRINITY_DN3829_c0_g1_i1.p1  ORF type:complete len:354 (+),score=61.72 TRINITY_DN3829_c0_g1_i1:1021-2082(+)
MSTTSASGGGEGPREVEIEVILEVERGLEEIRESIVQQNRERLFKVFGLMVFNSTNDPIDTRKHKKKEDKNKEESQPTRRSQRQTEPPLSYAETFIDNDTKKRKTSGSKSSESSGSNSEDNNLEKHKKIVPPKLYLISAQKVELNEPIAQLKTTIPSEMENASNLEKKDKKPKLNLFSTQKTKPTEKDKTTKHSSETQPPNESETEAEISDNRFCHNCRRKSNLPKISCTNVIKHKGISSVCGKVLDESCLFNRYGVVLSEISGNWTCPKCLGICNCALCMKNSGQPAVDKAMISKLGFGSVAEYLYENEYYSLSQKVVESESESVSETERGTYEGSTYEDNESEVKQEHEDE